MSAMNPILGEFWNFDGVGQVISTIRARSSGTPGCMEVKRLDVRWQKDRDRPAVAGKSLPRIHQPRELQESAPAAMSSYRCRGAPEGKSSGPGISEFASTSVQFSPPFLMEI
jgi:hypothetical protein